ncbi:hypothetical protein LCGC14_2014080 [marine sediment metagenome]|uniref:Uncharacterized protein n=1 Tax=marine sediment metagenome TaxID=412755 RepID=A0A0F9FLW9_9ZZZZ
MRAHTAELMSIIELNCPDSIKVVRKHYTSKGTAIVFRDKYDGQKYKLIIERAEK